MVRIIWLRIALVLGLLIALANLGCAGPTVDAPVALGDMSNPELSAGRRKAAMREAGRVLTTEKPGDPAVRETLKRVIWVRGNGTELRIFALDILLSDEAGLDDTRNMLALMLPVESSWKQWAFLRHVGSVAIENGWTDLTVAFVRSLSRPYPEPADRDRPEYAALVGLHPDRDPADVVFDVFAGRFESPRELRERDRLDAWSLLGRLDPAGERAGAMLASLGAGEASGDELVSTLAATQRRFGVVPMTGEGLSWAEGILAADHAAFAADAERVVASLGVEQRRGLGLRHLAPAVWADAHRPEWLGLSRAAHLEAIDERLAGEKHYTRTGGSVSHTDESLRRVRDDLVWGDTLSIRVGLELLMDPGIPVRLFELAEADRGDTSTEHGGVLTYRGGRFVALDYPPRPNQRLGDRQFVASYDLLRNATTGLFHFHFHASEYDNRSYSGPSAADLDYAERFECATMVFTFIDKRTLNADYFQPGRKQLDLGIVRRP